MQTSLLGIELGNSLATLRNGVFGKITWKDEADSCLDFARAEGVPVVHVDEASTFAGDPLEDISDKGVHDKHGLVGDTDIWVDLLENLEDVGGESLAPLLMPLLLLLGGSGTLGALDGWLLLSWCLRRWLLAGHRNNEMKKPRQNL